MVQRRTLETFVFDDEVGFGIDFDDSTLLGRLGSADHPFVCLHDPLFYGRGHA